MAILDLFSKREKRKSLQGQEDVFQYDTLPEAFRVQVIYLWHEVLGEWHNEEWASPSAYPSNQWWAELYQGFCREKGQFRLVDRRSDPCDQLRGYLLKASARDAIDLIELVFGFVDTGFREINPYTRQHIGLVANPDAILAELNGRFREHGIGYEFRGGEIIRVDSKYIHNYAVKPAIELLHAAGRQFDGAMQEFMGAHERYRKGEHKDAITWALKAFESTLKAICTIRRWPFDPTKDTAKNLLDIVFKQELIPDYLQTQFTALRSVLESGVPTVRNKTSGHGQGAAPTNVPEHMTRYALNLAASNIVFLIESHQAMR